VQSSKDGPHSPPKKRTCSKRAAKESKEIKQLKRWTDEETKLELTLSCVPGCAVSYIGTLCEDYKDDTFSFQPDAPPAQSIVPPMHIALDPRSWQNSAVVMLYGRSPAIFVKDSKNQIHLTIRESRFHKLLTRSPKPKSDSTALLQQLRAWARDSMTVYVCLLQPSHTVFFRCQVFELPQDVFRFSRTTTPDFDLIIWPQDYDYEIQSAARGKRLILESQSDSLTIMIADTPESLEETLRSLPFKTQLIQ
jgi:hypothetical protein